MMNFVLASESSLQGHPDKLCDRISDALVDACLADAPRRAINAECALASGVVFVALRHAGPLGVDPAAIARRVIAETGFAPGVMDAERATVIVDAARDDAMAGGGDDAGAAMATVIGYAGAFGAARLPAPIAAAHALACGIDAARRDGALGWLSPDGQAQAAVEHVARRPTRLRGVALRLGTGPGAPEPAEAARALRASATILVDSLGIPDGAETPLSLVLDRAPRGPAAHAGLTGRKSADDGYGGFCRQGSSALSGKDPSRVERAGAYAARHAALSVVAAGLARECEVQLCYAPGSAAPIGVDVDTFGSGSAPDDAIAAKLRSAFDFRAPAIAERFELWRLPVERGGRFYAALAAYGHFGRSDLDLPWERPDPGALG